MKRFVFVIGLTSLAFFYFQCAGTSQKLSEPKEEGVLIIGSVLVGSDGFKEIYEHYRAGIEVVIVGRHEVNGKTKQAGYTVWTNGNGYFFLQNVPEGEYSLKGIKTLIGGEYGLTIVSDLKRASDVYYIQPEERIMYTGDYFPFKSEGRVCDLMHHVFMVHRNGQIVHNAIQKSAALEMVRGKKFILPYTHEYFLEKYPISGWRPFIEQDLERITGM